MKKRHGAEQIVDLLRQVDVAWERGGRFSRFVSSWDQRADVLSLANEVRRHGSADDASAAGAAEGEYQAERQAIETVSGD